MSAIGQSCDQIDEATRALTGVAATLRTLPVRKAYEDEIEIALGHLHRLFNRLEQLGHQLNIDRMIERSDHQI